jgi:hypothetical protein
MNWWGIFIGRVVYKREPGNSFAQVYHRFGSLVMANIRRMSEMGQTHVNVAPIANALGEEAM